MALPFSVQIPFAQHLGLELLRLGAGEAELALNLRQEQCNSYGVAHGGVLMTLLDVAMAHAARSPDEAGGELRAGVVTVEMKTSFMRPGQGRLLAPARALHRTATLAFCEAHVQHEDGSLVAHATATFKFMRALPAGADGRQIRTLSPQQPISNH